MRHRLQVLAGCALLTFLVGCGGDRPPRQLPFPAFDSRSPFPELVDREEAGKASPETSAFARSLRAENGTEEPVPVQSLPLGNGLAGELPEESWAWSADPGLTLAVHRGSAGIDALIYTEPFSSRMLTRPSEEIRRFQRTVLPDGAEALIDTHFLEILMGKGPARRIARDTGLDAADAARLVQLLKTRTAGRGFGFRPGPGEGTGWRWVGRNGQGVTLRLSRASGIWGAQRDFPAHLVSGLAQVSKAAPELAGVADWLLAKAETGRARQEGPAYLLLGSVTDEHEAAGAHLAILCAGTPSCATAEDLAAFLGSIRLEDPGRLERLRDSQGDPGDLAREAGIALLSEGFLPGSQVTP